jgi:hypothetical protein
VPYDISHVTAKIEDGINILSQLKEEISVDM